MSNARIVPMCFICRKPVDSFTETRFATRDEFTAKCHGETQVITITALQMASMRGVTIDYAFRPISAALPDGIDNTGRRLPTNNE